LAKIDREIDFHHYTRAQMRAELDRVWGSGAWRGLRRVRVIHGAGEVLGREFRAWCDEKGLAWTAEPHNPGVTILLPGRRAQTTPAPPHRPMARLKHRLPPAPTGREEPQAPVPSSSDAQLFAEEIERIAGTDSETLRRRKRG
jgi:hypothetical protein